MSISTLQLSAREFTLYNDTLIFQKANLANAQRSLRVEYDAECSSSNQDTLYVASGNKIYQYNIPAIFEDKAKAPVQTTYQDHVRALKASPDSLCVLTTKALTLHKLSTDSTLRQGTTIELGYAADLLCITSDFIVLQQKSPSSKLVYYLCSSLQKIVDHDLQEDVKAVLPDAAATHLLMLRSQSSYILQIATLHTCQMPLGDFKPLAASWKRFVDGVTRSFYVHDRSLVRFYAMDETSNGISCRDTGATRLSGGMIPQAYNEEGLICLDSENNIMALQLHSGKNVVEASLSEKDLMKLIASTYGMSSKSLTEIDPASRSRKFWLLLARHALLQADIRFAKRVYRHIGEAAMVQSLERISSIESKEVSRGFAALYAGEYNKAQTCFLNSSEPHLALEMRCDLDHLDQAVIIATNIAPQQLPSLICQYALQCEMKADYLQALSLFRRASASLLLESQPQAKKWSNTTMKLNHMVEGGIIRNTIQMGEVNKGLKQLIQSDDKELLKQCGSILRTKKIYREAANLYERASAYNEAAEMFIEVKDSSNLLRLRSKITSDTVITEFGHLSRAQKQFRQAVDLYRDSKSYPDMVSVLVQDLNDIDQAVDICRNTRSREAALIVAQFLEKFGDSTSYIQFCVVTGLKQEAYDYAANHNLMSVYAEANERQSEPEEYNDIATELSAKGAYVEAGKCFMKAKNWIEAAKSLMQCHEEKGVLDLLIESAVNAGDKSVQAEVARYLSGSVDGKRKPPRYLHQLSLRLEEPSQATEASYQVCWEEQTSGEYRRARDVLYQSCKLLETHCMQYPEILLTKLNLLHTYVLAKVVPEGSIEYAMLLARVADNLTEFPHETATILSTVIAALYKAGLKTEAHKYSTVMIQGELKTQLDPKLRRKIEGIIRRPEKNSATVDETPCGFCTEPLPAYDLACRSCRKKLPMCIATGQHLTPDWCFCPHCKFSAIHAALKSYTEQFYECPMCCISLKVSAIRAGRP